MRFPYLLFFIKIDVKYVCDYPYIFTLRNEVAKVMFLQVCVCPQGGGGVGGIPACLAGGIPACLAAGLQEGCLLLAGACSGGCGGDPPASRRLLMRTVRILLECILVQFIY